VARNGEKNQEQAGVGKGFGWVGVQAGVRFHELRRLFISLEGCYHEEREAQTYHDEGVDEVGLGLRRDGSVLVHDQVALPGQVTVDKLGDSNDTGERCVDKGSIQHVK